MSFDEFLPVQVVSPRFHVHHPPVRLLAFFRPPFLPTSFSFSYIHLASLIGALRVRLGSASGYFYRRGACMQLRYRVENCKRGGQGNFAVVGDLDWIQFPVLKLEGLVFGFSKRSAEKGRVWWQARACCRRVARISL